MTTRSQPNRASLGCGGTGASCNKKQREKHFISSLIQLSNIQYKHRISVVLVHYKQPIIMGKTASLTVVQKMIIITLGKPQNVIAERAVCSQSAVSKTHSGKVDWKGKVWKEKVHKQQGRPQN